MKISKCLSRTVAATFLLTGFVVAANAGPLTTGSKFIINNQSSYTFDYQGANVISGNLSGGQDIAPGQQDVFLATGKDASGKVKFVDTTFGKLSQFNYSYAVPRGVLKATGGDSHYRFTGVCARQGNEIIISNA